MTQTSTQRLLPFLRCPKCSGNLREADQVRCSKCDTAFESVNGVLDLAPNGYATFDQKYMGSAHAANVYEDGRQRICAERSARTLSDEFAIAREWMPLDSGSVLLDVATGPINWAMNFAEGLELATRTDSSDTPLVVATDLSQSLLELGVKKVAAAGYSHRLFAVRSNAHEFPIASEKFTGVSCAAALHLMGDDHIDGVLKNFHRVLVPNGVCIVQTWLQPLESNMNPERETALNVQRKVNKHLHLFDEGELEQRSVAAGFELDAVSISEESIMVRLVRPA